MQEQATFETILPDLYQNLSINFKNEAMNIPQIKLNILTFHQDESPLSFYFSETKKGVRISKNIYPKGIEELFPGITCDDTRELYTTFTFQTDDSKELKVFFAEESKPLYKLYYTDSIGYYFRKILGFTVRKSFVRDNQVWLPLEVSEKSSYLEFEKYTLKVQFMEVSDHAELLLSYDGVSKVLNRSVSSIIQGVDPKWLNWIWHQGKLYQYEKLVQQGFQHFDEALPVLNLSLQKHMELEMPIPKAKNGFQLHYAKITNFIQEHLNTTEFKKRIPIHHTALLNPIGTRIGKISDEASLLLFGQNSTSKVPLKGLTSYGPYTPPLWANMQVFYILHKEDAGQAKEFHELLLGGFKEYKGLSHFVKLNLHVQANFSIQFTNKENPLPEIEAALNARSFSHDVRYIAIYFSPWSKQSDTGCQKIYYLLKEMLLKRSIVSQAIEVAKFRNRNDYFSYSLANMALAILAKLDGIPWRLNMPVKNELIIGVGAFRHVDTNIQYIGSAFSFDNKGGFNNFEYFMKHETHMLAGSISHAVTQFASKQKELKRLIIHFYKTMSQRELEPIEKALENLGLQIPVFIVSINKTTSNDIIAFDKANVDLMPLSGTYINVGKNKFLLFNNTYYGPYAHKASDGFPFPLKLAIRCNYPQLAEENQILGELLEQVYQFSRLYYKSVRQQALPITIKYPEMLATIAPHFSDEAIPVFGKKNLWFL